MSDENVIQFVIDHPMRLLLYTCTSALGWLIARGIRTWYAEWSSRLCRAGHKKKYVELTQYTNYNCGGQHFSLHSENDEWWATVARWLCEEPNCTAYGTDCFGHKKIFWKIEHGQVVPDKKLMESPPTNLLSPKEFMARKRAGKQSPKDLTFDDVFNAAEQALLKNAKKAFAGVEGKDFIVQKQSMCDCGCECDPQFTADLGELPRPKCDPLRHPQHHDLDVILSAKKKWSEEQKAKVCYAVKTKIDESKKGESNAT